MKPCLGIRTSTFTSALVLLGMIGLFLPASGQASLVPGWDFTGTLVAVSPDRPGHEFGGILTKPTGPFPASTISGSVWFNSHTPDSDPSHHVGQYNGAITALSYTITNIFGGPYQFNLDPNPSVPDAAGLWSGHTPAPLNSISVNADHTPSNQALHLSASVQNVVPATGIAPFPGDPGYFAQEFWINLVKPSASVFATDALPEIPPAPSLFSVYDAINNPLGQIRLGFLSGHDAPILVGTLTSLTVIPLPAAVYLFGTGVIGLAAFARRQGA
jgi:hypothetical protein